MSSKYLMGTKNIFLFSSQSRLETVNNDSGLKFKYRFLFLMIRDDFWLILCIKTVLAHWESESRIRDDRKFDNG